MASPRRRAHRPAILPWAMVCLWIARASAAQEAIPPEVPNGMTLLRDVAYGAASKAQRLDILFPTERSTPRPAIVHIHGGGWYLGDKGGASTLALMTRLVDAGYVALSINYRLSGEAPFPAAVEDCKLAVRWLRAHAGDFGVDPERIGAIGASAGGHLSAMLAVTRRQDGLDGDGGHAEQSSAIRAAVPICPPVDLTAPFAAPPAEGMDPLVIDFLGRNVADRAAAARRASPITYVREGVAPMLAIHGAEDQRVLPEQSKRLVEALAKANVAHDLLLVEGGRHGMGIARTEEAMARIIAFFDRHVKGIPPPATALAPQDRVARWQDAKFGLFTHWGPASLTGQEISWSRAGARPGLPDLPEGKVPREEYDTLYQRFNPEKFDAKEWARMARSAGMRYVVFGTKHHDGFCMFHSDYTDYDIASTPYQRDLAAELCDAVRNVGLMMGFYYSLPDWHHPDYLTENHQGYIDYLHGQVRELCTNYGHIDLLWFDGKRQGTAMTWDGPRLVSTIRRLQPGILINDRIWGDTDFETPEQVVGRYDFDHPWESCITLGQQWSWKPGDDLKTPAECIRLLTLCAGGGGNLLLNVGPMPDGAMEPRQVERLEAIGAWLARYGESIYETRGGPYAPSYWGAATRRGHKIYVHIFKGWESSLDLEPLPRAIVASRALTGERLEVAQDRERLRIAVPAGNATPPTSIIELTLDGPADSIAAIPSNLGMPEGATATGSNVRRGESNYEPGKAVDASPLSRWATDDGVTSAWLEIHLPENVTFDAVVIDEAFGSRIQAFEFKAKVGDAWKTFLSGSTVGRNWAAKFPAVTAGELRLEIHEATDGPTIRDIQLHFVK